MLNKNESIILGQEDDGAYIVSSEMNPPSIEEGKSIEQSSKIIENAEQKNIDIKKVGGFSKQEMLLMGSMAKVSSMVPNYNADKLKNDKFITPDELKDQGYAIINIEDAKMQTKCSIIHKDDQVYISFRGTKNKRNMMTDANTSLATTGFTEGRMHKGFYNVFKGLWPEIRENLQTIAADQKKDIKDLDYNITGHSMGGSVAKIAALYVSKEVEAKKIGVVTFGDPRVFDDITAREYEKRIGERTVRIVQHHKDLVPALTPGFLGYKHVGCQIRVEEKSGVKHRLSGYQFGVDKIDNKGMIETKSISVFYYPSKIARKLNEVTIGNIKHLIKKTKEGFGHKGWADREKEKLNNKQVSKNKDKLTR